MVMFSKIGLFSMSFLAPFSSVAEGTCESFSYTLDRSIDGAREGDPRSMLELAGYYACGAGVELDDEIAFRWTLAAAQKNYAPAMNAAGNFYAAAKNYQIAGDWFRRAANAGDEDGFQNYLSLYQRGLYHPATQNETQSLVEYKKALDAPNAAAALPALKRASELGLSFATMYVGVRYELGDGVQRNEQTALIWYNLCAAKGNAGCQTRRGALAPKVAVVTH
jgi:TPR repeat protein